MIKIILLFGNREGFKIKTHKVGTGCLDVVSVIQNSKY